MSRGKFIVFEGGEGTGKSTQARLLADVLGDAGSQVMLTREPGGAPGAEALRRLLVEVPPTSAWSPLSEALLHYAARHEHLEKFIRPALARGVWVISDRFSDSTTAYQGAGLGLDTEVIDCLRRLVIGDLVPDLTIVLDLEAEQALGRAAGRSLDRDRYESMDLEFHRRVGAAFRACAARESARYAVVDAAPDEREVQRAVWEIVRVRLGVP